MRVPFREKVQIVLPGYVLKSAGQFLPLGMCYLLTKFKLIILKNKSDIFSMQTVFLMFALCIFEEWLGNVTQ